MLAIKRYFIGRKRRNSVESLPDTGVACTCAANRVNNNSNNSNNTTKNVRRRRDVSPSPSLGGLFGGRSTVWNGGPGQESPPPGAARREAYRRSISLGQILQGGGGDSNNVAGPPSGGGVGGYRGTLTSAGSSDASPDSQTDARELTEFEKENLLFLKDLDNSYHHEEPIYAQPYDTYHQPCPQQYHRSLGQSISNTSLVSAYSDDSITGESTPRGGSPFPSNRRHHIYSPSRAQASYLIRSVSREEEECVADEEDRTHPAYRSDRQPGARLRNGSSIPVPMGTTQGPHFIPCTGDSSAPSSVSSWTSGAPTWWNSSHQYPIPLLAQPPPRMRPSTPPSPPINSHQYPTPLLAQHPPRMRPSTPPSPPILPPQHLIQSSTTPTRLHQQHHTSPPRIRPPTPPSPPPQRIRPPSSSSSPPPIPRIRSPTPPPRIRSLSPPPPMPRIRSPTPPPSMAQPAQASQIPRSLFSMRTSTSLIPNAAGSSIQSSSSSSSKLTPPKSLNLRGYATSYMATSSVPIGGARARVSPFADRASDDSPLRRPARQTSFFTLQEHFNEESPRKDSDPESTTDISGLAVGGLSVSGPAVNEEAIALGPPDSPSESNEADLEAAEATASGDGASSTSSESRRAATAFTIELDKDDDEEGSAKKLDITGPLSKWAPKHRRNLSLTKVEENKKVEERGGKPPVYRARSGTVGGTSSPAGGLGGPRKPGGYHSEGYFSSDQDEDAPRKTDMRSPKSPRTPDSKSPVIGAAGLANGVARSASQDFHRVSPTLRGRPASPEPLGASSRRSSGGAAITLNESANFLIEKMINSTPETKRKTSVASRPGDSMRSCCKGLEKKPSVADITGRSSRSSSDKGSKASTKIDGRKVDAGANHTNIQPFKVDRLGDDTQRDEDEVSEAGTYTIDKDSSPEVDRGRADIERGFALAGADTSQYSPTDPQPPLWDNSPGSNFKTSPSISRNSPNWIQQWAAQVAEQTSVGDLSDLGPTKGAADKAPSMVSPRGSKLSMLPSVSGSQDGSDMLRPRRKLPMPPGLMQQSYPAGGARDLAELEVLAKTRNRVTDNTPITSSGGYRIASFESHDSGGDSDIDTSTSYVMQEPQPPLRAKLKLSGLNGSTPTKGAASPRSKLDTSNKRDRSLVSDGGGLRRARLASEDAPVTSSRQAPLTPTERRKQQSVIRSASSSLLSSRRSPANNTSARGGSSSVLPSPDTNTRAAASAVHHQALVKSPSRSSIKKEPAGLQRKHSSSRSNSTMSSKEVDFQNWKRRKNYDPMKAAKDGRKKQLEKRECDKSINGNATSSDRGSPSPPGSLLRSASFHGTEGMVAGSGGRWQRPAMTRYHNPYTSEEDGPMSYDDEQSPLPPAPHASPLRRSPTSPHQLHQSPLAAVSSPGHVTSLNSRRASYTTHSDDSEPAACSPSRKMSLMDDTGSEGKRSPLSIGACAASSTTSAAGGSRGAANNTSGRSRAKIEALDNLVISTIHSLSSKVRGTSENLLQKLKTQYGNEDRDRADLLQNVLNHLNSESESASSQIRSTSRDLSGILKNLKKIQTALEVIDQVMVVGGGDYDDLEDLDWPQHNGSSDY